jgi:hypothetical protein
MTSSLTSAGRPRPRAPGRPGQPAPAQAATICGLFPIASSSAGRAANVSANPFNLVSQIGGTR